jgi:hypothetical protein
MEELLQKLLEADVLSEDTKKDLEDAFQTKLDEAIEAAKETAADDVRAELTEQWVSERNDLVEAVDAKVNDFLAREVEELKEDIERFRDLEAEYAEKLVEAKAAMSDELKNDLIELVEKVDAFLEMRLAAEIEELREDLDEQRKYDFGRRVFEAFAEEFMVNYSDEESAEATLRETQERLRETEEALEESEAKYAEVERVIAMENVLSPLVGRQREVMEAILRTVPTEQLEEGYKTFIGRVIRESEDSEKEGKVLAEGKEEKCDDDDDDDEKSDKKSDKKDKKEDKKVEEGIVITGDGEQVITEEVNQEFSDFVKEQRRLAGIE